MKLKKDFVDLAIESYDFKTWETVMKLNLLGFLQPTQHMDRVTPQAVRETVKFMRDHQKVLASVEKKDHVPGSVISALLWIETRHGDDRGKFHILSVYLHLLQSDRPANRRYLTAQALDINTKKQQYKPAELKIKMKERTAKRRQWAQEQIQALAQIYRKKQMDLKTLRGSFAGAFGLSQFIPSSYRDFSRSFSAGKSADLYETSDAIASVAHYLRKHGWKNGRSQEPRISSLMAYNNSRDYAESILEIALKAEEELKKESSKAISTTSTSARPRSTAEIVPALDL